MNMLRSIAATAVIFAPLSAVHADAVLSCIGSGIVSDGESSTATKVSFEIEALESENAVIATLPTSSLTWIQREPNGSHRARSKQATFSSDAITAVFPSNGRRAFGAIMTMGLSELRGGNAVRLSVSRVTGVFSFGRYSGLCTAVDASTRKF